jgi:hypothetical protein
MIDVIWLIAMVALTGSTVTATILLAVNFPIIHRAQRAVLASLNGLDETYRVGFEVFDAKVNQLEQRVQALEDTHG